MTGLRTWALIAAALAPGLVASSIRACDAAQPISKSWSLCAASTTIAVGTLHVPVDELRAAPKGGRYLKVTVAVSETLKGPRSETVVVRFFGEDQPNALSRKELLALDDRPVMIFLTTIKDAEDSGRTANYFAGDTPDAVRASSSAEVTNVRAEIARQAMVLRTWKPHPNWPHEGQVRRLIEKTLRRETATQAFRDLEKLGATAAPAIADHMDDRRPLAIQTISLENHSPNAFESHRIYFPKLVVDALAAILNQVTGQSFGEISNGGSEQERQLAVNGWRIYADMQQNGHLRTVPDRISVLRYVVSGHPRRLREKEHRALPLE